jgi:hypothetical protein
VQYAAGQLHSTIKGGKSVRRPAGLDQRYPERPEHISLALRRAGPASEAQSGSQFTDARVDVTGITQDDSDRLVGYRRLVRVGSPVQDGAGLAQGLTRTRQGQQQQIICVTLAELGLKRSFRHEADTRSAYPRGPFGR